MLDLKVKQPKKEVAAPTVYRVGVTGLFFTDGNYRRMLPALLSKIQQIVKYCKAYRVPVYVYVNSTTAPDIVKFLMSLKKTLHFTIHFVGAEDAITTGDVVGVDADEWIAKNCDVTLVIKYKKDEDYVFDAEEFVEFLYTKSKPNDVRITFDPIKTVHDFKKRGVINDNAYVNFIHEDAWQRVEFDRWNEVMDQMPEIRDPYDRDLAV